MGVQSAINGIIGATATAINALSKQDQAREKATKSRDEAVQAKKKTRRNFMKYLRQQPTSLGGTVGQLPEKMQKQIAAQYNGRQRKELMDQMDREAKKK